MACVDAFGARHAKRPLSAPSVVRALRLASSHRGGIQDAVLFASFSAETPRAAAERRAGALLSSPFVYLVDLDSEDGDETY